MHGHLGIISPVMRRAFIFYYLYRHKRFRLFRSLFYKTFCRKWDSNQEADSIRLISFRKMVCDNFFVAEQKYEMLVLFQRTKCRWRCFKIFELTGNCVFSQSFSGNNTIELTSEDLSTGLYFITIHSEEGNFMKKLVVQWKCCYWWM